jgi:3-deoxy-D-manno-octulosonic-acid transferase
LRQDPSTPSGDVILVDVLGKLAGLYALADVAFVGGSLVPCGGHNPLEPAALGKPVIFGPDMSDFNEPARLLQSGGGAVEARNADELQRAAERWLSDPGSARRAGINARRVLERHQGAAERTAEEINRVLAE